MSKARDIASAGTALGAVTATELAFVDGVTSAIQTQIDAKEATLPSQTGNSGKYLTTNGTAKSWGTVSQYALPSQTGNSGKFLTTNGTAESWGTVTTPLTFTDRLQATNSLQSIEYNGSNLYVAAGGNGLLYSSPDGITWTSRTSGFGSTTINKVAYGNGLWVAVGASGTITTSTDGITWTARTANMASNTLRDVKYANSLWVVVGGGGGSINTGGIAYSSNGTTWTRVNDTFTVGTTYSTVVYNGTNWIVGASHSTNNYLYASTPSGTWTAGQSGSSANVSQLFWDGTRNLELSNSNGQLRYSTSSTLGTTTQTDARVTGSDYYYNSEIYSNGAIIQIYSSVINANNTAIKNKSFLSPTTEIDAAGNLSANFSAIFAGAAGIIVTGNGHIYTSF
jgi:hypothetical protein